MLYDLLQESANQILSLSTKTLEEMKSDTLAGPLYIGTGQTDNLKEVVKMMKLFGLFIRDYDHNLYEGIPLKSTNSLGILVFKNHPFASKKDNQSK